MKRQEEIEKEWRRLARIEAWLLYGKPLLIIALTAAIMAWGMFKHPSIFGPASALIAAIGMPLGMWLNKRR